MLVLARLQTLRKQQQIRNIFSVLMNLTHQQKWNNFHNCSSVADLDMDRVANQQIYREGLSARELTLQQKPSHLYVHFPTQMKGQQFLGTASIYSFKKAIWILLCKKLEGCHVCDCVRIGRDFLPMILGLMTSHITNYKNI